MLRMKASTAPLSNACNLAKSSLILLPVRELARVLEASVIDASSPWVWRDMEALAVVSTIRFAGVDSGRCHSKTVSCAVVLAPPRPPIFCYNPCAGSKGVVLQGRKPNSEDS